MLVVGLIKDPPRIYRTWILLVISDLFFVSYDDVKCSYMWLPSDYFIVCELEDHHYFVC